MPGVDFLGAVSVAEPPPALGTLKIGSLKAHKPLPRAYIQQRDTYIKPQYNQGLPSFNYSQARDSRRETQVDRSKSSTQEPTEKHVMPVTGLPSTPTIDFRDNFKSWIDDKALRDPEFLSQQKIAPGNSPLITFNSPNLIKNSTKVTKTDPQKNSGGSVRTLPESRTDSFRTARENLSSDDENHSPGSPSLHPSRQKWLRNAAMSQPRDIGLGLGVGLAELASERAGSKMKSEPLDRDFVTFDGMYASQDSDDAESLITARNIGDKSTQQIKEDDQAQSQSDSPTLGVEIRRPVQTEAKGRSKQGRKRSRTLAARSTAAVSRRRSPALPPKNGPLPSHTLHGEPQDIQDIQDIQEKRLSQASTASTIVEAMVIQSSQSHRRPSLRHTGKLLTLDGTQDHHRNISGTSLDPDDAVREHSLRTTKNADRQTRESSTMQMTLSGTAHPTTYKSFTRSNVVVVPDRRSSLQSSTISSKQLTRDSPLNSKPQSSRPTTAPENSVGYFDIPHRGRTLSVVIQHATPVNKSERDLLPHDHSTGSLAAVVAAKDLALTNPGTSIRQPADAHDIQVMKADRSGSGDWTALRPPSALITPRSLRSHSSTPGTLEVNEATAISIFPHTAESIVVIKTFGDPSSPKEQSALIAGNASIGLPSNNSPFISEPLIDMGETELMDSSLQNPRKPPSLPGLKIIPPTPANAGSSSEDTVEYARASKRSNPFKIPLASLKRAMSTRRHSESSISNPFVFSRTLSLRETTAHRSPRVPRRTPELNRDNQLHPFWRPRTRFIGSDSDSDSDSEFGDHGVLSPQLSTRHRPTIRNKQSDTVTPPNPRRTMSLTRRFAESLRPAPRRASASATSNAEVFDSFKEPKPVRNRSPIPKRTQSLTRRIGDSLRLPSTPSARPRRPRRATTADWNNQPHYEFVPVDQRQYLVEEAQLQPRNIGFQNLADRIERRRSLREESRREERRQVLKGQINSIETDNSFL